MSAPTTVLEASRQELALYRELDAVYGRIAGALDARMVDPAGLAADAARAAVVAGALQSLGGVLSPHRLLGEPVDPEIAALWRDSAALAASVADANRRLQGAARTRQVGVGEQLAAARAGRAAVVRYQQAAVGGR